MSDQGTYEKWSAKDIVAHVNYWEDVRAARSIAWVRGEELEPLLQFEQANAECYERFSTSTWDDVRAYTERAHKQMTEAIRVMNEENLAGPSEESEERKMWESLVGSAYTHKLAHYAEFYMDRGRQNEAAELWSEWAEHVSPLDAGPEWQGGVHYNAACSLALAGDRERALEELRKGLELRPSLKPWSRRDSDLAALHDLAEYKKLFAPSYWWEALEANPQAEALADQFMRALSMFRLAVSAFPEEGWLEGETNYQRPAGMGLHILQTIDFYSAVRHGDRSGDDLTQINWQVRDASKLPSQKELLRSLDRVEKRLANFITAAELQAEEEIFPWTGFTVFGRMMYTLRHTQHHLADMAMELQRRGLNPPSWQ
jgi:tetratricopeptide (TPR) repeat protein